MKKKKESTVCPLYLKRCTEMKVQYYEEFK